MTPTRRRIDTVIGQLVERYHAKRVGARDGWHLWSRWQLLSHTLAAYLCQQTGLGSLRFAGRTRGRLYLLEATSWALLVALPWYSADVQGWAEAVSGEQLLWFEQEPGRFRKVPIAKPDGRRLLAEGGVNPG